MASIYHLKPWFQGKLRPATNYLARHGVTANMVTMLAVICSFAMGAALFYWQEHVHILYTMPVILFLRMALNAIDGMLAREHNMQSKLGAILNELGDILSDTALYLPLAFFPQFNCYLIVAIVILAALSETAGILGCQIGAGRRYDGPCGKSDRATIFGILCLVVAARPPLGAYMGILQSIIVVLLILTIFNRIYAALKEAP